MIGTLYTTTTFSATPNHEALIPLPSISNFSPERGWGGGIGLGLEYETAYDGSDERELEIDPAGAVQYRHGNQVIFWEGVELGWRSLFHNRLMIQMGIRSEGGREADDSDDGRLDGLEDRDREIAGVLEFRYALDENWRNWLGGRIMAGDTKLGTLGVLAAGHKFESRTDGLGTEVFAYATFGDTNFFDRDFGISATESSVSGLSETDFASGYRSFGVTLTHRRAIGKRWQILGQAGYERYGSEASDSPISRKDYEFEVGLSGIFLF